MVQGVPAVIQCSQAAHGPAPVTRIDVEHVNGGALRLCVRCGATGSDHAVINTPISSITVRYISRGLLIIGMYHQEIAC